jgi:hypothetical protein
VEHQLTAISLFVCGTYGFTYLVKALFDARMRTVMVRNGVTQDLIVALAAAEHEQRRWSALRWGVAMCAIAVGFVVIQIVGWREVTPAVVAVLAGAIGIGQLLFYAIARTQPALVSTTKGNP